MAACPPMLAARILITTRSIADAPLAHDRWSLDSWANAGTCKRASRADPPNCQQHEERDLSLNVTHVAASARVIVVRCLLIWTGAALLVVTGSTSGPCSNPLGRSGVAGVPQCLVLLRAGRN